MIGLGGTRRRGVLALASALSVCAVLAASAGATGPLGSLTPLTGTAGCVSTGGLDFAGTATCASGVNVEGADAPAISPDGKNLYVGVYGHTGSTPPPDAKGGIAVFARDPLTGAISQLPGTAGCITIDGSSDSGAGSCTAARAIDSPDGQAPAISADGRFVYYASQGVNSGDSGSVAVFSRDPSTGALTQLPGTAGCFTGNGSSNAGAGTCGVAPSLSGAVETMFSPDQKFLYVVSYDNAPPYHTTYPGITVFSRDAATGQLTLVPGTNGCLTYAGYSAAGAATCQTLHGFGSGGSGQGFVISPDGRFAYATEYNNPTGFVLIFSRDPATGVLTQLPGTQGCLSNDGSSSAGAGTCTVARSIDGAWELALSPDGTYLVVGAYERGLAEFKRDPQTGLLTQLAGTAGCFSDNGAGSDGPGTCTAVNVSHHNYGLAFGPEGRTLTTVSYDDSFASTTVAGISAYSFDPATGALAPLPGTAACVTSTGASHVGPATCGVARALQTGYGFAISPDGAFLYATSDRGNAINVFSRSVLPVCSDGSATMSFELPASTTLSCRDPNGDPFTYAIMTQPAHGTLSTPSATGGVTYTPNPGFVGTDSFTFAATGAKGTGTAATFALTVQAPTSAKITFGKPKAKGFTITVPLSCLAHGATCGGRATISATLPVRVKRHRTKLKTSTVASRTFTVLSGRSSTVSLSLSGAARTQLTKQHKLALTITAVVTQPDRRNLTFSEKLTATLPKPKPKHRKHH